MNKPGTKLAHKPGANLGSSDFCAFGQCGLGLIVYRLTAAAGMKDYGAVSPAIRRVERLMRRRKVERQQWKQISQKYNIQM